MARKESATPKTTQGFLSMETTHPNEVDSVSKLGPLLPGISRSFLT